MATGKISTKSTLSGSISTSTSINATVSSGGGSGSTDHSKLINRDAADQHPIAAITNLQTLLDEKLDSETAMPLIEEAIANKAKGLFYDTNCEVSSKPFWYLTSEIDPTTKMGTKASIISGPYNLGAGGGGGGGTTTVTVTNIDPDTGSSMWPSAIMVGATCSISVYWTSKRDDEATGSGTLYCYVNDTLVSKKTVAQGKVSFDITDYIGSGDNKIEVKVIDTYSTTKNLIGTITGVVLSLTSDFNSTQEFSSSILYTYIPTGSISKTVHFIVDGTDIGTMTVRSSGEQQSYIIPAQKHGAHSLQVYFIAIIDGEEVKSNTLKYSLICFEPGVTTPIIASTFDDSEVQEQYIAFNIYYRVYTPGQNLSTVNLYVNDELINTISVDKTLQTWNYRPLEEGTYDMKIVSGDASKEYSVYAQATTIDVEPVSQNLALQLNAIGRSNGEALEKRKIWADADRGISAELQGFNWVSNGWMQDDDGSTVLRLSGDARVTIPYSPFSSDIFNLGKTIEIELKTSDVMNYEYQLIRCLAGGDSLVKSVTLTGEDDRTKKFAIDSIDMDTFIAKVKEHNTYIYIYDTTVGWTLDGIAVDLTDYGITLKNIDLDPEDPSTDYCQEGDKITVVYAIIGKGFYITPQLAKMQSQQTSLSTQYKEDDKVRLTFVINKATDGGGNLKLVMMYINGIMSGVSKYPSGDTFDQSEYISIGAQESSDGSVVSSKATVDIYNIRVYDNNLTRKQVVNNWIADMQDPIEKAEYYHSNDNYDEEGKLVISKLPTTTPYMTLIGESLPSAKKDKKNLGVSFVYPADASRDFTSEDASTDVQGTSSQYYYKKNFKIKFQNGFTDDDGNTEKKYKIVPPLAKKEKTFTFKADVASSEGANNVELVRYFENSKNWLSPGEQYQDPEDTEAGYVTADRVRVGIDGFPIVMFHQTNESATPEFYGKMNFNNDKSNDDTYGFVSGDECWEFLQNNTELVLFQSDDMTTWQDSFESRYPEENGDGNPYGTGAGELDKLTEVIKWVVSTYRKDTDTEEEKAAKLAKFKSGFETYFDKTSSLFYYLYTELFLMVDSRAKNAMLTYMKKRTYTDASGATVTTDGDKWYWFPYDMDTALGINNEGLLVFDYDTEDTDIVNGGYVYNGQTSAFWCNVRDAFTDDLKDMYVELRAGNAENQKVQWDFDKAEAYFEDHQKVWSENIFNEDSYVKYLEPLELNSDASYLGMLQGSKLEQRRWWMYSRFKYLDSKYLTGDASSLNIMLRAYKRSTFEIVPYMNCYVTAVFDQAKAGLTVTKDGTRGETVEIVPPETWDPKNTDSVVVLYSADQLSDIGDISGFMPGYANFSAATKLQRLKIGDASTTFENTHLTGLVVGNNHLLTYLDARNCSALGKDGEAGYVTKTIELDNCVAIEEAYFDGTQILGVKFPVGGNLKKVHLPGTITDLTIRNHPHLEELKLEGTDSLQSVWLEDIPSSTISAYEIVMGNDLNRARLIGIDETFTDYNQIDAFYTKLEKLVGQDAVGTTCKIQEAITGTIRVATIPYANYVSLSARFPLITIAADQIICTVQFYDYDGTTVLNRQTLVQTEDAITPLKLVSKPDDWDTEADWGWEDGYAWDDDLKEFVDASHKHYNNYYQRNDSGDFERVELGTEFATNTYFRNPNNPTSASKYYTFSRWDTDYRNVMTDLDIKPVYAEYDRHFIVNSDTDTLIIWAVPVKEDVIYGEYAHRSALENIPEKVYLDKWTNPDGTEFTYESADVGARSTAAITAALTITAKWVDEGAPTLTLTRKTFKSFHYRAVDNVGIDGYAVTKTDEQPTSWIPVESVTPFEGDYDGLDEAATYYFWVKDSNGNTACEHLIAYPITRTVTAGIDDIILSEAGVEIGDFALSGTTVALSYKIDFHYKNAAITVNGESAESGYVFTVDKAIALSATCDPRKYTVNFNVLGKGTTPDSQEVTYLTKIDFPGEQYSKGFIIQDWYKNYDATKEGSDRFSGKWDFDTDVIDETMIPDESVTSITLYAYWIAYQMPTKITVVVPKTSTDEDYEDRQVMVAFSGQNTIPNAFKVDWGDGTPVSSSEELLSVIKIKHTYDAAGTYVISITNTTPSQTIILGNNPEIQVVNPAAYMVAVEFSWDIQYTANYAFRYSNIASPNLTPYMSRVALGAFQVCPNITEVTIPDSVTVIEDQAFASDHNLEKVTLPKTLRSMGAATFQNCEKLSEINIDEMTNLTQLHSMTFENCQSLTDISLPDNISIIGTEDSIGVYGYVFDGCTNLEHIKLPNREDLRVGRFTFSWCPLLHTAGPIGGDYDIEFPWIMEIPAEAFWYANPTEEYDTKYLTSVTLPSTIARIGKNAFMNTDLTAITWPVALTEICANAFRHSRLEDLSADHPFPNSLTTIGDNAFFACSKLQSLYLNNVRSIGYAAFEQCKLNCDISLPATIEHLGHRAFATTQLTGVTINFVSVDDESKVVDQKTDSWFYYVGVYKDTTQHVKKDIYYPVSVEDPETTYGTYWNVGRANDASQPDDDRFNLKTITV